MVKTIKLLLIVTTYLILFSCSQKQQVSKENVDAKFSNEFMLEWNSDSTFVLGIKKDLKVYSSFSSPLEYFIFSVETDSITFKEIASGGSVKCISPSLIQIDIVPGNIIEEDELINLTYKFNVVQNKKITNEE